MNMKSRRYYVICVIVVFYYPFASVLSQHHKTSEEEFYFDRDGDKSIILANHSIFVVKTNSVFRCSWSCVHSKKCVSLNFAPTVEFCQLNDAVAADYPEDVQPQDGHWYFELRGKSLQQMDLSFVGKANTLAPSSSKNIDVKTTTAPVTSERTSEETSRAVTTAHKTTNELTTFKASTDELTNGMMVTGSMIGSLTKLTSTGVTTDTTTVDMSERTTQVPTTVEATISKTKEMSTAVERTTDKTTIATSTPTTTEAARDKTTKFSTTVKTSEKTTRTHLTTDKTITTHVTTDKTTDLTTEMTSRWTTTEESTLITTKPTTAGKATTPQTTETIGGQDDTTLSYTVREECYQYLYYAASAPADGVYKIQNSFGIFSVYCELIAGGWTVIQRRTDKSVSFNRDWTAYLEGFGDIKSNFWLGLNKISSLCSSRDCHLYVVITDWADKERWALYDGFSVEGTDLFISGLTAGDAGNSLPVGVLVPFSTFDADNDASGSNCANIHGGGWWYTDCGDSSPNGNYYPSNDNSHSDGIIWRSWQGDTYSLKTIELRVRNVNNI